MTERSLYDYALIEMDKVGAPSLLLEDYNYFMNKAVQQYINKGYNRYPINQQASDDLRVLQATAEVAINGKPYNRFTEHGGNQRRIRKNDKMIFSGILPADYMHILNCVVEFEVMSNYKCYKKGEFIEVVAKRFTPDLVSGVANNVYLRPSFKRPYFYINNMNTSSVASLDGADAVADGTILKERISSTRFPINNETFVSTSPEFDRQILQNKDRESINPDGNRVANATDVRIEIRYGDDSSIFVPRYAYIDYIKAPMFIKLTYDDITSVEDHTRVLEFPDAVCYEIVNNFVMLLMENAGDPRLQTVAVVNDTVAAPQVAK